MPCFSTNLVLQLLDPSLPLLDLSITPLDLIFTLLCFFYQLGLERVSLTSTSMCLSSRSPAIRDKSAKLAFSRWRFVGRSSLGPSSETRFDCRSTEGWELSNDLFAAVAVVPKLVSCATGSFPGLPFDTSLRFGGFGGLVGSLFDSSELDADFLLCRRPPEARHQCDYILRWALIRHNFWFHL